MASTSNLLLRKISSEDEEFGRVLEDADITEDADIQALCYEALKDIFPGGGKKIVKRSKVWKIIQSSLNSEETSGTSTPSSSKSVDLSLNESLDTSEDDLNVSTPKLHAKSLKLGHPHYTVYEDSEIIAGARAGNMSNEVRNRLVRGTIHNMTSAASCSPFCRLPSSFELEEMSKSLIIAYPCLHDAETGHGVLFKQLKRRLSNSQPTKKPQGPCPKKRRKNVDEMKPEEITPTDSKSDSNKDVPLEKATTSIDPLSDDNNDDEPDNSEVMKRHYKSLQKELQKKKPNPDVLNLYLNKEFKARRKWLTMVPAEGRCQQLLAKYCCFKDHVEVIEEARRVLGLEATGRGQFMGECIKRLVEEIDYFIYFGINVKGINPPSGPKLNTKIIHVLNHLPIIFSKQKPKKIVKLVHELQDHEDPTTLSNKQAGNVPVLVYDKEFVYVLVMKRILFKIEIANLVEAVVAFLATFYMLDFDYPKDTEIGMNILQVFVFNDNRTPQDIATSFNAILTVYKNYKAESS